MAESEDESCNESVDYLSKLSNINPFKHRIEKPWYRWVQIVIMSVTIVPLRIIFGLLCVIMGWLCTYLIPVGEKPEDFLRPDHSMQRKIVHTLVSFLARVLFFIFGLPYVSYKGKPHDGAEAPVMVLAPHTSFFDVGTVVSLGPGIPSAVAQKGSAKLPLIGRLLRFVQPVLVERESRSSRFHSLRTLEYRARRTFNGKEVWPRCVIFPEGTTTNGKALISFKAGAFKPGVPVQPILIRWNNPWNTTTWSWDSPSAYECVWLTLCQFYISCSLEFLPVYIPNEVEKSNPTLYARNVRNVMAEALGVPTTEHTYEDCRLMCIAGDHGLPRSAVIVEFSKLCSKLPLDYDGLEELLKDFVNICLTRERKLQRQKLGISDDVIIQDEIIDQWAQGEYSAKITLNDFSEFLKLPESEELVRLFRLYDRDGSGFVDFREFVLGFAMVSRPALTEQNLRLAFNLFDIDHENVVSLKNFELILQYGFSLPAKRSRAIFKSIKRAHPDWVTFDEFKAYFDKRPEYAKIFDVYTSLRKALEQATDNKFELHTCTALSGVARSAHSMTDDEDDEVDTVSSVDTGATVSPAGNKFDTPVIVHTEDNTADHMVLQANCSENSRTGMEEQDDNDTAVFQRKSTTAAAS